MANVQLTDELARLDVAHLSDIPTTPAQIGAATAAQGDKADTAVQPDTLAEVAATIPTTPDQIGAATAAQGAKADTAVQPAALAAVAETIPTTAADIGAATAAQGAKADSAVQLGGLTKAAVGLGNVDNTADTAKPVSTAQQTAIDQKVDKVTGKQLSTEDYSTAEKTKLSSVATNATANPSTTSLTEGTNLYFTVARVLAAVLTGLSVATGGAVVSTDTVLVAIGKLQNQVSLRLPINATFTETLTSGTQAQTTEDFTSNPAADSTQVSIGRRIQSLYTSAKNMLVGGYLNPFLVTINTAAGSGTHDKMVVTQQDANLLGGNIQSFVGYEAGISSFGANTVVGGTAFYLVKNMTGVAGFEKIATPGGYVNQDPRVLTISAGPYLNSDLREIAPSRSAGLIVGRYYSSPLKSMTTNVVATGVIYVTYVYVPRRCTLAALGLNVTTAATGNCRLGLYKVANGVLTTLVVQTGDISTAATGIKEGAVSQQIDSGVYALVAEFSGTPTINWHEINTHDMIGAGSVSGYSEQAYVQPFAYAALPASPNILPTFAANTIEPHLFFRVAA